MTAQHFEGTCDVCGSPIESDHDSATEGIIDISWDDDGRVYTWIRHYATAPEGANPDCARYFSRVYLMPDPPVEAPAGEAR